MRITRFKLVFKLEYFLFLWLLIFLVILYFADLDLHSFHLDEYKFVRKSYFFDLFFFKRNLSDPRWGWDAEDQPKVGPYIYGLSLHLMGINDIEKVQLETGFNDLVIEGVKWPYQLWFKGLNSTSLELEPALILIQQGRKAAVIFSLAALLLLFFLLSNIKISIFAFVATFLLGINQLMMLYSRRAMTDSFQLFFLFANLGLIFLYLRGFYQKRSKRVLLSSFAIGINTALSAGTKVSGILTLVFFFEIAGLLFFSTFFKGKKLKIKLIFLTLLLATLTFFALFVFFHPYLYHDTFRHFIAMFLNRLKSAEEYKAIYPGTAVYGKDEAVRLIFKRTLLPGNWWGNFGFLGLIPLDLVLFLTGIVLLFKKARRYFLKRKEICLEAILFLWIITTIVSLTLYLGNDWPRYYLPTVAGITIAQAYALAFLFNYLINRLRQFASL